MVARFEAARARDGKTLEWGAKQNEKESGNIKCTRKRMKSPHTQTEQRILEVLGRGDSSARHLCSVLMALLRRQRVELGEGIPGNLKVTGSRGQTDEDRYRETDNKNHCRDKEMSIASWSNIHTRSDQEENPFVDEFNSLRTAVAAGSARSG
ncbi:hypothetical protein RRG08_045494 [Elysia crispata]|uniref:Uncharacterized protein n=1 Tax=Elysia crispata TaxID=231223 RepID=A0AAE1AEG3_9GAST|nr:hypothetical protein RRG08_045494 [Elysia crispata]